MIAIIAAITLSTQIPLAHAGKNGGASGGGGGGGMAQVISMGSTNRPVLDCYGTIIECDADCVAALSHENTAMSFLTSVCDQMTY